MASMSQMIKVVAYALDWREATVRAYCRELQLRNLVPVGTIGRKGAARMTAKAYRNLVVSILGSSKIVEAAYTVALCAGAHHIPSDLKDHPQYLSRTLGLRSHHSFFEMLDRLLVWTGPEARSPDEIDINDTQVHDFEISI